MESLRELLDRVIRLHGETRDGAAEEFRREYAALCAALDAPPPEQDDNQLAMRVLEYGRCKTAGCFRLAGHPSAHRFHDPDAEALWQTITYLGGAAAAPDKEG